MTSLVLSFCDVGAECEGINRIGLLEPPIIRLHVGGDDFESNVAPNLRMPKFALEEGTLPAREKKAGTRMSEGVTTEKVDQAHLNAGSVQRSCGASDYRMKDVFAESAVYCMGE